MIQKPLASFLFAVALSFTMWPTATLAQGFGLQQKVAAIEAAVYKNKQMLGQYTWQQQETVRVRGDVKKTALYQVQLGPSGKPVKTDISQSQSSDRRKWGIRHRITQNYIEYGQQIASLASSYTQFQPGRLKQLYAQGNVSLKSGGAPGLDSIVATNYVKLGDSVTFTFDRAQKAVVAIAITSYLSGPTDVVTIAAQFAKLADGTSHVSTINVDGQSKSLTVQEVNSDYQKRT
ncbi:MAG: hypothetical protein WB609_13470 [Candidatus Cybelea sp.]